MSSQKSNDVRELAQRARKLICLPPGLKATSVEQIYDHPMFYVNENSDRLIISLKNPDRSVYWESLQVFLVAGVERPIDFQVNAELVPELLSIMRQVMVLDDLSGV